MGMKTSSVYVDEDKVKEVEEKGFNLSSLTRAAVDIALSEEFGDLTVEMKQRRIDDELEKISTAILELEHRLGSLKKREEYLSQEKQRVIEMWEYTKNTVQLSRYIRSLNQIIIISDYDAFTIAESAKSIIDAIMRLNPAFKLEIHIDRFKKAMES